MRSARSGSSAFGVVAGAAIVSFGIGLLGVSTAAEASTAKPAADVSTASAAAPSVCGQPPATTSAVRTVPAGRSVVVLDAALLSSSQTPKSQAPKSEAAKSSSSPSPSSSTSSSATPKATATAYRQGDLKR